MPELPEVETTIGGLKKKVLNRTFLDVWTDAKRLIKRPKNFTNFKKELLGNKIKEISRRGKNILFKLSGNKTLLIHQKLTGHLLVGNWRWQTARPLRLAKQGGWGNWKPKSRGPLEEKINRYIHLMFFLGNGQMLALSDLRKFAKVELWDSNDLNRSKEMEELGPEPLEKNFTFRNLKEVLKNENRPIKQVLMDQNVIAGIGNIYSDEILFKAGVHPLRKISALKEKELKLIYQAIKKILTKAIELRGTSVSDYRDTEGRSGFFEKYRKVYRRQGEKCKRCATIIKRLKIGGRSAHFCPNCQKIC